MISIFTICWHSHHHYVVLNCWLKSHWCACNRINRCFVAHNTICNFIAYLLHRLSFSNWPNPTNDPMFFFSSFFCFTTFGFVHCKKRVRKIRMKSQIAMILINRREIYSLQNENFKREMKIVSSLLWNFALFEWSCRLNRNISNCK